MYTSKFFQSKIWSNLQGSKPFLKVKEVFCQGISVKEMIIAGILGALIGVMPFFGVSTMFSTLLAIKFKLNLGVVLFFTYAVSPIHPFLFIPFIHLGENIYGIKHTLLTFEAIKNAFQTDITDTIQKLWLEIVCGLTGWLTLALPLFLILIYFQKTGNEKYTE
jgi:uncharacterized protein (DUF2062 family)